MVSIHISIIESTCLFLLTCVNSFNLVGINGFNQYPRSFLKNKFKLLGLWVICNEIPIKMMSNFISDIAACT